MQHLTLDEFVTYCATANGRLFCMGCELVLREETTRANWRHYVLVAYTELRTERGGPTSVDPAYRPRIIRALMDRFTSITILGNLTLEDTGGELDRGTEGA